LPLWASRAFREIPFLDRKPDRRILEARLSFLCQDPNGTNVQPITTQRKITNPKKKSNGYRATHVLEKDIWAHQTGVFGYQPAVRPREDVSVPKAPLHRPKWDAGCVAHGSCCRCKPAVEDDAVWESHEKKWGCCFILSLRTSISDRSRNRSC
jgi:hypothetical protein